MFRSMFMLTVAASLATSARAAPLPAVTANATYSSIVSSFDTPEATQSPTGFWPLWARAVQRSF
jgi:hypothetical protein